MRFDTDPEVPVELARPEPIAPLMNRHRGAAGPPNWGVCVSVPGGLQSLPSRLRLCTIAAGANSGLDDEQRLRIAAGRFELGCLLHLRFSFFRLSISWLYHLRRETKLEVVSDIGTLLGSFSKRSGKRGHEPAWPLWTYLRNRPPARSPVFMTKSRTGAPLAALRRIVFFITFLLIFLVRPAPSSTSLTLTCVEQSGNCRRSKVFFCRPRQKPPAVQPRRGGRAGPKWPVAYKVALLQSLARARAAAPAGSNPGLDHEEPQRVAGCCFNTDRLFHCLPPVSLTTWGAASPAANTCLLSDSYGFSSFSFLFVLFSCRSGALNQRLQLSMRSTGRKRPIHLENFFAYVPTKKPRRLDIAFP